jgi:putative transposase
MPRKPRRQEPGLTYHVFTRAIRDEPIYQHEFDRLEFLRLLRETVRRLGWICHAYCEMTTHYHLLVTTPEPNLAAGMQWLNSRHAEYFNHRYGLRGHLFRGRYGAVTVEEDGHFLVELRYVVLNPVRAGICTRPERWPWSSYPAMLGLTKPPDFLTIEPTLRMLSRERGLAVQRLRAFIGDSLFRAAKPIGSHADQSAWDMAGPQGV